MATLYLIQSDTNYEELLLLGVKALPVYNGCSLIITKINAQDINNKKELMALSNDIWWTRKAKIQTEKRLLSNAYQSQLIMLWYAFFGVAVSIYYLKFNTNSEYANVAWVIYSVLSLTMSGFLTGRSFKERSSQIKECYEALKGIQHKAKLLEDSSNSSGESWKSVREEYEKLLGLCENHTDSDMVKALCIEHLSAHGESDEKTGLKPEMTKCPTYFHWFVFCKDTFKQAAILLVMYILPIAIFFILWSFNECQASV
ncbi:SLATT domain-containing protein [Shewanella morhuae]|uniref:SLATT domain-containing protein n=1 Tax=Shewanella morhuae TaxID=365591 RepID=UPI0015E7B24F|nr:SLATT domain-containing protein [Shewanella morhuae]